MNIFGKKMLMAGSKQYTLTVITNPISATCTLYYNDESHNETTATVKAGDTIGYSVSHSTYGTETGSIIMDSNKILICEGTYATTTAYKKRNFTEVGSLSKSKSIISGFSSSIYALTTSESGITNIYNKAREEVYKITTGSNVSSAQTFRHFMTSDGNGEFINIYNSKFGYNTRNQGSQPSSVYSSTTISANTDYWVKLIITSNNAVTLSHSTDGINYIQDLTHTCTVSANIVTSVLGCDKNGNSPRNIFLGSIDLKESYIKIHGSTVWQGIIDGTSSNYDYTEPAYSYYWDKVIT